jgi:hypothetical protein
MTLSSSRVRTLAMRYPTELRTYSQVAAFFASLETDGHFWGVYDRGRYGMRDSWRFHYHTEKDSLIVSHTVGTMNHVKWTVHRKSR